MKKNLYYLLTILLFIFVLVSCNTTWDPFEDEDNDDIEIPFVDNATEGSVSLTEGNADNAVLATYDIFTMQVSANNILTDALIQIGFLTNINSQNGYSKSSITDITTSTKALLDSVRNKFQGLTDSTTIDCYDDGEYRYTINPSSIKFIFRECKDSGYYLNGEISFKYTSTYSQLKVNDEEVNETFKLSSPRSSITYYTDYSLKHTPKTSKDEIELNGSINAIINGGKYSYKFKEFLTEETRDGSSLKYDISGDFYTTYCNLDGWLTLDTDSTSLIDYKLIDNCPSNGELKIIGDNATVKVNINYDESIDLYIDSSSFKSFGDCYDARSSLSCFD